MSKVVRVGRALALMSCGIEPALAAKQDHGRRHPNVRLINGSNAKPEAEIQRRMAALVAKAEAAACPAAAAAIPP